MNLTLGKFLLLHQYEGKIMLIKIVPISYNGLMENKRQATQLSHRLMAVIVMMMNLIKNLIKK